MKDYQDIFGKDFEMPEVVREKMDVAFTSIQREKDQSMDKIINFEKQKNHTRKFLRKQTVAAACAALLVLGTLTTYAAYQHFWSPGMKAAIQSTDAQQQKLVEQGVAAVFSEEDPYGAMAVTDHGITVTPKTVVVDERTVYVSLEVQGYALEEGKDPIFEYTDVYLEENPTGERKSLTMGASFYDGILVRDDGGSMYEDGSPLRVDDTGKVIAYYTNEEGNMEFVICGMVEDPKDSLLGETLHIDLKNLGTAEKAVFSGDVEGEWSYRIPLTKSSITETLSCGEEVEGTEFVLESIEISSISVKLNYHVTGEAAGREEEDGIPDFLGVVLKDGRRITCLGGRSSGYLDETKTQAYEIAGFGHVIEREDIEALLFSTQSGFVEMTLINP